MNKISVATATPNGVWIAGKLQKYGGFAKKQDRGIFLNPVQRKLYRTVMYGFRELTEDEFRKLTPQEKSRISANFRKGKRVLHVMKCKKFYNAENKLLNGIFAHIKIGSSESEYTNIELPRTATLNKLGINTKDIIDEFIKSNVLPQSFYSL